MRAPSIVRQAQLMSRPKYHSDHPNSPDVSGLQCLLQKDKLAKTRQACSTRQALGRAVVIFQPPAAFAVGPSPPQFCLPTNRGQVKKEIHGCLLYLPQALLRSLMAARKDFEHQKAADLLSPDT